MMKCTGIKILKLLSLRVSGICFLTLTFCILGVLLPGRSLAVGAQEFTLLGFKQDLDRANLALVVDWLGNDLKRHSDLHSLADQLEERKGSLLEQTPLAAGALNYETLIMNALSIAPGQETELRRIIRYSVDYLNLEPVQNIEALRPFPVPENTAMTDFDLSKGFPTELLALDPDSPHTIVDLQHYNRRRLGRVPLEYALDSEWPIYLFDCEPRFALRYLKEQGFNSFYQLNAFYSRWGKEVFLARRGHENVLVYADIYGSWMEDHLLYMLRSSESQGKRLDPQNLWVFHIQGDKAKSRFLKEYRHDLAQVKQKNSILVLGYYGLLGREMQALYNQNRQQSWFQEQLDAHELQYQLRYSSEPEQLMQTFQDAKPIEQIPSWQASLKQNHALQTLTKRLQTNCPECSLQQEQQTLSFASVGQRNTGKALLSELIRWQDTQGNTWNMINLGANHSLYGDMTRDLVKIALELGFREIVFAGSAGAIRTDLPVYSWVVPTQFRDYQGQSIHTPNHFSFATLAQETQYAPYLSYGTVHQGVRSPVAETQDLIRLLRSQQVDTLDVEVAEIARMVAAYPDAHFSAALLVTDYPGAFLKKQEVHLDQVNYQEKYRHLPVLIHMLRQKYGLQKVLPLD